VINTLQPLDVVLTLGAGDITDAGSLILERFARKAPHLKVALLCGGTSAEREVSLMSAANIFKGLNPTVYQTKVFGVTKEGQWFSGSDVIKRLTDKDSIATQNCKLPPEVLEELTGCDIAIPVFHGPQGEDGMMQAFLDTLQIPYVGCEYRGAALCMQKAWTKYAALIHHIPTAPFIEMRREEYRLDPESFLKKIEASLSYPVWIKPVHLGSSVGVSRAANREEAKRGAELSFQYDEQLIAEKEVEGREIEFAVLGNEHIRVINSCEILTHGSFYDYDKKYGAQATGTEAPARLSPLEKMVGEDLAARAYLACGCKGMARVDFFLDSKGYYWLNEINPFPGFTAMSGYPKMCAAAGMSLACLLDELIALGLQRSRSLAKIRGK
jgi:D-alanine--D-alanine ligase